MEPIARPSGFDARIWYDSDEQEIHVRTEDGCAVLPSGKRRRYHGEERVVEAYPGERVRLCICDPALATGDFEHNGYSNEELVVEQDDGTPVGVHPGGLIVLRIEDIPYPANESTTQSSQTLNDAAVAGNQAVGTRHLHSLLRIVYALADMNQLVESDAATRVSEHLHQNLGAESPKPQTVSKVMAKAYSLARAENVFRTPKP